MAVKNLTKQQLSALKRRCYSANYRAHREYGREDTLSADQLLALWISRPLCEYCDRRLTPSTLSPDHKIPLAAGGANSISNIVLACRRCNRYKRAMPAQDYKDFLQLLKLNGFEQLFFQNYRPQSYRRRY